jgi:hypothetical protein
MRPIMVRRLTAFLALFAVGALDAPLTARPYPSLTKRPVEARDRVSETETPAAPAPVEQAPADPALVKTIEDLQQKAVASDSAFASELAKGRKTIDKASGAAPVSEAWVDAQVVITALDTARYDSIASLATLDTLHVERMNNSDGARVAADLATIDPARSTVLAMVDSQNDTLDRLRQSLKTP